MPVPLRTNIETSKADIASRRLNSRAKTALENASWIKNPISLSVIRYVWKIFFGDLISRHSRVKLIFEQRRSYDLLSKFPKFDKRIINTSFTQFHFLTPDPEKFHLIEGNSSSPVFELVKKQVTIADLRNRNPSRANYRSYPWPVSKFLAGQLGQ